MKKPCIPDCWKVLSLFPCIYLRMLGKGLQLKTITLLFFFLWLVNKVFEKLVNNRIVDYLEKCGLFPDFQNGFKSSWSTADLLAVVSDRIAGAFNRSGAAWAVVLDISKAADRVWHTGLLRKLQSYEISGQIFYLISSLLSNRPLWMGSLQKNIQLMLEFNKAPFLALHFSYYTLMIFLIMLSVILLSMLMILLSILSVIRHVICGNNLN